MNKAYEMLISSAIIKQVLNQMDLGEKHTLLAFLNPGSNWYFGAHRDYRRAEVDAFMVVAEKPSPYKQEKMFSPGKLKFIKLIRAQALSYGRLENGIDPVEGEVITSGPPLGVIDSPFQKRMAERISFFSSGL